MYVRDLKTNTTTLVRRAGGRNGAKANGDSTGNPISRDGRLVAFTSAATNLDPNDTDSNLDVYVRDLKTNTTTLVSRTSGRNGAKANDTSDDGFLSPNPRYISFDSRATNLTANDRDTNYDIYVRDLHTDRTFLISHASGRRGANANGNSLSPNFADNGRQIVFQSGATNLDRRDTDTAEDIYLHDVPTDRTYLISGDGPKSKGDSRAAATATYADDIAFQSQATNLDPDTTYDVYVHKSPGGR